MPDPAIPAGKVRFFALPESGGHYMDINRPAWPYDVEIHMPIAITQAADGSYPDNGFFDPLNEAGDTLGTYDYRLLSMSTWRLPEDQKIEFNAFFNDPAMGRAENFMLRLGPTSTGFFPFGIDMGDYGDFIVRLVTRDQTGSLIDPYKWFEESPSFVMVTRATNALSLPGDDQGGLYIGDAVFGLLYPQEGIKPKTTYNFQTQLSVSGSPNSLDSGVLGDSWETGFELLCSGCNAYQVVDEIVNNKRTADIPIIAPAGYYLYGADQSSGGTYTSKFLGSSHDDKEVILKISHIGFDQFRIPLNFWMKAKTA